MASLKSLQVKLVDLGCAQRVTKLGNVVKYHGHVEFTGKKTLFYLFLLNLILIFLDLGFSQELQFLYLSCQVNCTK